VIHVIVLTSLEGVMKKQNIYISSKAGNDRVEAAIPELQRRFGWAKDQATAVAIRMESQGKLKTIVSPAILLAAAAKMKREKESRTQERIIAAQSSFESQNIVRTNRLRDRKKRK